jgi:hypothetical protein
MTAMSQDQEMTIFLNAIDLEDPQQVEEYLNEACAGRHEMQHKVRSLLQAHYKSDHILDRTPAFIDEYVSAFKDQETLIPLDEFPSMAELGIEPGMTIGAYKLITLIGEGGFGLVFEAEQTQPVRRKVALKVIKPGMDTREVISRFAAERQLLAQMDHPNVARVFDAGTTEQGRPYFVMELVNGTPITDWCDEHELTIRERLMLFIDVCCAVQHAHHKGIIHRDIKPSNILVTAHDGKPLIKIIDFGVAKAIGPSFSIHATQTHSLQMIGTPLYMSPEQTGMGGLDIDTRSDIYSLGVVLYELISGDTPYDQERFRKEPLDEIRRIIREEEPVRPSARTTLHGIGVTQISTRRHTEPRELLATLRGDLDRIVMKSLEKDRGRRYETASAFSADILRFLNEEPIEARPPSTRYRLWKFARRNKLVIAASSAVLMALIAGTTVSTIMAIRANSARVEADRLRQNAVDSSENLKAANVLIDNARAYIDQSLWHQADEQYIRAINLQPDHYMAWTGRGSLYLRLGLWDQAAVFYAKALDLGANANSPGWWGIPQLFVYAKDEATYSLICENMLQMSHTNLMGMNETMILRSGLASIHPYLDPQVAMDKVSKLEADYLANLANQITDMIDHPDEYSGGQLDDLARDHGPPGLPRSSDKLHRGNGTGGDHRPPPHMQQMGEIGEWDYKPNRSFPEGIQNFMFKYIKGLACYRQGDYTTALTALDQAELEETRHLQLQLMLEPVRAMTYFRMNHKVEAEKHLAKCHDDFSNCLDYFEANGLGQTPIPLPDWLEFLCLYREAKMLIHGADPLQDPRLQQLQESARISLFQAP